MRRRRNLGIQVQADAVPPLQYIVAAARLSFPPGLVVSEYTGFRPIEVRISCGQVAATARIAANCIKRQAYQGRICCRQEAP
jgi:hypothetical protein